MPLYDFRCEECGARFERRLSFSQSDTAVACPTCASQQTRRLLSAVAVLGVGSSAGAAEGGGCGCGGACSCHH